MTLSKIIVSCILFLAAGKSLGFFNHSYSIIPGTTFQLPKSDLPFETSVKFISPSFRANDNVNYTYELNVINNYDLDFEISMIEVFDTRNIDQPIHSFDDSYLIQNLIFPGRDGHKLKANSFAIIHISFPLNESANLPSEIFHRIHFSHKKANGDTTHPVMDVALISLPILTDMTIGPPLKGGNWFYTSNQHKYVRSLTNGKAHYPQRFAIDWIKVDEQGRYANGDLGSNENWVSYNQDVLAVASGTVIDIQNGIKENKPFDAAYAVDITNQSVNGNSIVLDIGNGVTAVYAHLQPISPTINVGDHIIKGQVIGHVGNSGKSDNPHLHFHLEITERSHIGGEGISFHFESFTQLEEYSDQEIEHFWSYLNGQLPMDNLTKSHRNNELPVGNGVIIIE